ncbi:MAG TPA: CaiB/BaiF CoA-transferase family protein [Patescibacteria group bacterium]|nr:CaiB/BaiF CoA-transferase family protein [Patescibacteria group bacterium]
METRNEPLPLDGLRVVALEQAVSAPFCSRQLAEMGADVIKIERPGEGDFARGYDNVVSGQSAYFVWLNRGKRSIVTDLKQERGLRIAAELIRRADVFVHNLIPGAVERLGFGYEELSAKHPRLIWCGISGYGPDGPYRDKKAYDMLVQAESGIVSLTGTEEFPARPGLSMADIGSGLYAYSSILAALIRRARTGRGDRIDISMFECMTEWVMPPLYVWHGAKKITARAGVRHNMVVPFGAYQCADGPVMFGLQNSREWRNFCEIVMGMPELAGDARFRTNQARLENRQTLEALIEEEFGKHTRAEVFALLEKAMLPTGAVNDIPAVESHPQLKARHRWTSVDSPGGAIPALIPPHNLSSVAPRMGAVPALGEHTKEILAEIGFTEAEGD